MQELLSDSIPLDAYVDSKTSFNFVAKNVWTAEKQLQIDMASLQEGHPKGEIRQAGWIEGMKNPAAGLTRVEQPSQILPLLQFMATSSWKHNAERCSTSFSMDNVK